MVLENSRGGNWACNPGGRKKAEREEGGTTLNNYPKQSEGGGRKSNVYR